MMIAFLRAPQGPVRLAFKGVAITQSHFADIFRVGLPATLSPLQSILSVLIVTGVVARFGAEALAGYGIGARLEFLVIPIAFAVGAACLPMVGVAIGAGDVARARRVAWTAGALAFAVLAALGLVVTIAPGAWAGLFTRDAAVLDAAHTYLRIAGFGYPFFALGLCLHFGAQGAGRIGGPLAAQALRLAIIAGGGWAIAHTHAPLWTLFALTAVAMIALGLGTATAVRLTPWDKR